MRLPDFARTTTFRWALIVASAFLLCTLVLFGFVYWQTAVYVMNKYDVLLVEELQVFASNTPERLLQEIEDRLLKDPQHIKIAACSAPMADASRATSKPSRPALRRTSRPMLWSFALDSGVREVQKVRLAARSLPSGENLVIGRNIDEITEIAQIVVRALALGLLPAFILAILIGMVLSQRAQNRVSEVNRKIQRIVAGDLRRAFADQRTR